MNDMMMILVGLILLGLVFEFAVELLNLKSVRTELPSEFVGWYDEERYKKSQIYLKENTRFGLLQTLVSTISVLGFLVLGGFSFLDQWVRSVAETEITRGLLFVGVLSVLSSLVSLPFSLYHTFVIEEKYGFNRTTLKTFFADRLKGLILGFVLGVPALVVLIWFFDSGGKWAWFWAWLALSLFQIFIMFIAPAVIMPLFNKFTPLPEGELKTSIEEYARSQNFSIQGIFTMDGSRRSTRANAFFTGFGRYRRIVLFDTLIANQTVQELVAVLAHEIGHFREKHIFRQLTLSLLSSAVMFILLSVFLKNPLLFEAFGVEQVSTYASLVFFAFLYSPISSVISLYSLHLSRKYEFEADRYSTRTYGHPEALISALKKLSVENLSNLSPHPLKVFLEYTHPPILQRVAELRRSVPDSR